MSLEDKEIPSIEKVLATRSWDEKTFEIFSKSKAEIENDYPPDKGGRSQAMMRVANDCAESGLTEEEIYAVVLDMDQRWEKYIKRTDKHKRYVDIIERAKSKHPHGVNNQLMLQSLLARTQKNEKTVYTWQELIDADIKIEWFFNGLLSTTGYGNIYGPPGTGKTQFAIRMAMSAATGQKFMQWGNEIGRQKCAFFSLEMGPPGFKYFQSLMHSGLDESYKQALNENFYIIPTGESVPLDKPEGRKFFEDVLQQLTPKLAIVDSMNMLATKSLADDQVANELTTYLESIRNRFNCAVVVVHHDKKKQVGGRVSDQDNMYGSRFLSARADFVMMLRTGEDKELVLEMQKTRYSRTPGPIILTRTNDLDFINDRAGDDISINTLVNGPNHNGDFGKELFS